ncbi:thioether cross-link-forming SCIFF peptide maturase [Proteiniclasticum ruminis]|uniref:thioether cross-link-forming SCIFF peptide maturase n=1 Tax=Proteiniclasticum ruminis TaxID=398199 RepID=UPI00289E5CEE|nr:thioether cross-link-forming SCIFF peptide maturase [Proteiniclasticum ruminis]
MIHKFTMNGVHIAMDINGGSVHVLDEITYDMLDYYEEIRDRKITLQEAMEKLSKYPQVELASAYDEIRTLEEEELLYTEDPYEAMDFMKNRKPVVKALCLNIAHDCNLMCKYCFAKQGDFGGKKCLMSLETGKKALEYLVKNSRSRRNLEVDFFGGEPLMNFQVVKDLVQYGRELEKEYHKNFRFTITTNGVLLNDEAIDFINTHMDNAVLSLDGRKQINDDMRLTLTGKGSYDVIVPKYQKLIEKRGNKSYYIRGTFTRDSLDFSEDVKHFKELGFVHTSMEPVVSSEENPYAIREEDLPKILEEYEKLAVYYADLKEKKDPFSFFHFMVDLTQGPCVIKRISGCGAGTEYLCITPEGDLYPCHQFVGNEAYKMGNLYDEELTLPKEMQSMFKEAHIYRKEDCKTCFSKFYCSGGCHANALSFNGDILKPYGIGCEMQRKRLECAIMVEAKRMLSEEEEAPEEKVLFL